MLYDQNIESIGKLASLNCRKRKLRIRSTGRKRCIEVRETSNLTTLRAVTRLRSRIVGTTSCLSIARGGRHREHELVVREIRLRNTLDISGRHRAITREIVL